MMLNETLEANAKLVILHRALKALVEECHQFADDGRCLYCNAGPEHGEHCVYQTALDLANTDVGDPTLLDELERLKEEIQRAETIDNARLEGISARLDGKPLIGNPYVNDDETSVAAREIWNMGWVEQDEEIRTNAILSSLKRLKAVRQQRPYDADGVKRLEETLFKQLDDYEKHKKEK